MIFAIRTLIMESCPKVQSKAAQKWFLHGTNGKLSRNCVIYKPLPRSATTEGDYFITMCAISTMARESEIVHCWESVDWGTFSNRLAALSTRSLTVPSDAVVHTLAVLPLPSTPCAVSEHIFHISPQSQGQYTQDPGEKFPCLATAAAG